MSIDGVPARAGRLTGYPWALAATVLVGDVPRVLPAAAAGPDRVRGPDVDPPPRHHQRAGRRRGAAPADSPHPAARGGGRRRRHRPVLAGPSVRGVRGRHQPRHRRRDHGHGPPAPPAQVMAAPRDRRPPALRLVGPGRRRRRRRRSRPLRSSFIRIAETSGFAEAWGSWVIDDLFGLIVITPAIATLRRPRNWSWLRSVEYLIAVAYTAASTYYIFFVVVPGEQGLFGWPYLVVLGSIWIAVRLGVQAVAPVVALQFWAAVVATVSGLGSFAEAAPDPLDRLLAVELFSIAMASVILALGGAARCPASLAGRGRAGRPAPARGHRRVGRRDLRQELRGPRRVGHLRPGEQGRCRVRRASGRRGARTARRRAVPAGGRRPDSRSGHGLFSRRASPSPRRAGSPTRWAESGSSPTSPTR